MSSGSGSFCLFLLTFPKLYKPQAPQNLALPTPAYHAVDSHVTMEVFWRENVFVFSKSSETSWLQFMGSVFNYYPQGSVCQLVEGCFQKVPAPVPMMPSVSPIFWLLFPNILLHPQMDSLPIYITLMNLEGQILSRETLSTLLRKEEPESIRTSAGL